MNSRSRRVNNAMMPGVFFCMIAIARLSVSQENSTYQEAKQAFAERRYADAARLFSASSARVPKGSDALLMEGKALINLNNFTEAELVLRAYYKENVQSAPALYLLGYVLQHQNRPRESLEMFNRAAAISAPQANDLKIVGLDYVLLNDYIDAIRWFNGAVEIDPRNGEAWYDLGRAQMNQGNFIAAEQAFHHTLSISPNDVKALNNLGLSYEAQNRIADALRAYQDAITAQRDAIHPNEQPLLNFGTLLITQNRAADAIGPLEQAVRLAPRDPKCHEELSRSYSQTEQLPQAREQMETAVALDPQNSRLHFQLGRLYKRLGLTEKANLELKLSARLFETHASPEDK